MDRNFFDKVNSVHGNLSINVNSDGDVEISQNRLGNAYTIMLTTDEMVKLGKCLLGKHKALGLSPIPTKSNSSIQSQKIKEQGTNAYEHWTKEDDEKLHKLYTLGLTTKSLAENFKRGKGAVESRLKKLGLK